MKKTNFVRHISGLLLLLALSAVITLSAVSCANDGNNTNDSGIASADNGTQTEAVTEVVTESDTASAGNVVGEGQTQFTFTVVFADNTEKTYTVNTDEKTVGAALLKVGLIAGEDSQYGLYVKTVDGETHDYDTDKSYWSFYVNGEYASSGVDSTNIEPGAVYSFKAEK